MSINNINWSVNPSPEVSYVTNCTLYKDYLLNTEFFDFNSLSWLFNDTDLSAHITQPLVAQDKVFFNFFQARNVHEADIFKGLHDILNENFNTENVLSDSDLFFSFANNLIGTNHEDPYDVYLLNLYGKTHFKINHVSVLLEPYDLLFIPKNTPHNCISIDPRITLSFGIREDFIRYFPWEDNPNSESAS
jgi:mannose-6-phosphate isomerase-like protein (cupin superfamily)